jgi:preprotein translocase subunit SecA
MGIISWLLDNTERDLRKLRRVVHEINALEPEFERLTDEQLRAKTDEFKQRLADGENAR